MSIDIRIGLCQMCSTDSLSANLQQIISLADSARSQSSLSHCFFPENSLYMLISPDDDFKGLTPDAPEFQELGQWSKKNQCSLVLGSVLVRENGKTYNATVIVNENGELQVPYRKIHLFDVVISEHMVIQESKNCVHGSEPAILNQTGWSFGLSICYDVRFAELYSLYAARNVDAICVPSAFTVPTGQVHWHTLLRARAIESQAYVIAPAQSGIHQARNGKRKATYGHSLVYDPWGELMAQIETGPGVAVVTLQKNKIADVRRRIPMSKHRRINGEKQNNIDVKNYSV